MTTRVKLELAAAVAVLILCLIGLHTWLGEHDARLKAETTIAAQQKAFDQAGDQVKQLQASDKDRDAQTAATIAKLSDAASKQVTPAQIASWIPAQLQAGKALPQPITIQLPPATAANPAPNAIASIPQADLPALRDEIASCQECGVKLSGAQADVASRDQQLKLAGEQLSAEGKERDAYKLELKGGTFWHRVKGGSQKVVIGIGIGLAFVCGSGHCK